MICITKDTMKIINSANISRELLLQNAISAGFTEEQVEILTQEEYDARKPIPQKSETKFLKEQVQTQRELIDTLMFEILPTLLQEEGI